MEMIRNCAVDGGNSSINILVDGKIVGGSFPSVVSEASAATNSYRNIDWTNSNAGYLRDKLHVETSMHVTDKSKFYISEFVFGEMAEEFDKDLVSRPNKEKYNDRDLAKQMIAALSFSLLEKKISEEGYSIKKDATLQFNVNLATGLPYREGVDNKKKQEWYEMFKGTHKVRFKHPVFKNISIDLVVEGAYVLVEGEFALTYELNKPGGLARTSSPQERLSKSMTLIDIGGHTTEIVTIGYKEDNKDKSYDEYDVDLTKQVRVVQYPRPHLTFGVRKGIATIMEDIIPQISEDYSAKNNGLALRSLNRRDIEKCFTPRGIYEKDLGDGKVIREIGYLMPEVINVNEYLNVPLKSLATMIVGEFHNLFQDHSSEIGVIYLCGGGSRVSLITETIREELSALGYDKELIVPVENPVFANAIGYYYALGMIVKDCPKLDL